MKTHIPLRSLSFLALSLTLLSPVQGATFYVSTQGSDSNPGSSALPFRTITHAYSFVAPGDTILVLPGVYTDYTSGWGIHLGTSGTAASPITLEAQPPGSAIIDGLNATDRNVGLYIDGSYNIVNGFEIRNGPKGGITIWANNNQILNCNIHNNGNPSSTSTDGRDGIYSDAGTSGNVYAANQVHHNGRTGSNLDHGLYLCGQNEIVVNNLLYANAACGLQIAGYTTVSNLRVYNNVLALNGTDGIILWQALNGIDIKNNIFYENGHYGIGSYAATGTGVTVDHDLFFGNGYGGFNFTDGGSTYTYTLGTTLSSDPLFVNPASSSFDPHLSAGSPAILAALNLSSFFTTDLAGTPRQVSGAWDLGAYVYSGAVGSSPAPTISLTSPLNGATYTAPATINLSANVVANGHSITSVQFYNGSTLLGTVLSAPYSFSWNNVAAGSYALNAVALYDAGSSIGSSSINVSVSNLRHTHKH